VAPMRRLPARPYMRTNLCKMDRMLQINASARRWGKKAAYQLSALLFSEPTATELPLQSLGKINPLATLAVD
jgi:hypothetical protein